jgi:hypothetical protein
MLQASLAGVALHFPDQGGALLAVELEVKQLGTPRLAEHAREFAGIDGHGNRFDRVAVDDARDLTGPA